VVILLPEKKQAETRRFERSAEGPSSRVSSRDQEKCTGFYTNARILKDHSRSHSMSGDSILSVNAVFAGG
jgi:hypothetical protein